MSRPNREHRNDTPAGPNNPATPNPHEQFFVSKVQLAGDEEDHGADVAESDIPTSLALSGLEQAVDGFQEAVGLAGRDPGGDALEMITDHLGDLIHDQGKD